MLNSAIDLTGYWLMAYSVLINVMGKNLEFSEKETKNDEMHRTNAWTFGELNVCERCALVRDTIR